MNSACPQNASTFSECNVVSCFPCREVEKVVIFFARFGSRSGTAGSAVPIFSAGYEKRNIYQNRQQWPQLTT